MASELIILGLLTWCSVLTVALWWLANSYAKLRALPQEVARDLSEMGQLQSDFSSALVKVAESNVSSTKLIAAVIEDMGRSAESRARGAGEL